MERSFLKIPPSGLVSSEVPMSMTREEARAVLEAAVGRPWAVTRAEFGAAIEALELDAYAKNEAWELRYLEESAAVHEGRWPTEVPIPPNVD